MILILISVCAILLVYYKLIKPLNYWKERGVKYDEPMVLFGSVFRNTMQKESFAELIERLYKKFKNERYFGWYQFVTPILTINDLELIKKIAIKDFEHFTDHPGFSSEDIDPLWSKNLFASKGDKWKDMRPTLSPSFTSSKMKLMFNLMEECSEQFTNHFINQNKEIITVEMKDIFTRFTNDVIATCSFGIQCDSLKEKENEFYLQGLETTDFSGLKALRFFVYIISPFLTKLLGIKVISTKSGTFFRKLIKDAMTMREEKGIFRPDMIHLLMEARKGRLVQETKPNIDDGFASVEDSHLEKSNGRQKSIITDDDIVAQALIFFFAGFDTVSTLMSYICYELAVNKDIQDRLRQEIQDTLEECNGKITYEGLMKMKYLDMVVSETLRKWPPTPAVDRVCTKEYVIRAEREHERDVVIPKGSMIRFPIYSLHRDPELYPDPEKFDPERFNDENKGNIRPCAYIPFGIGPRNCIGSRFALMENKLIMFNLLKAFEIVPVKESVIPLVLSTKHFNMQAKGGMWFGLKKIK